MKTKLTLVLMMFCLGMINAQGLPQHIELEELGLSFDIPQGWTGQLEGEYILLGHQSLPGLMILFQNNSQSTGDLKNTAMQGIREEGVQLSPAGDFKVVGDNRVEGMYTGYFNGSQVKSYAIGLINGLGSGMSILILTESNVFTNKHKDEANKLARSVKFYQAKESTNTKLWKNKLIGRQLKYMYTNTSSDYNGGSVGLSEKTTIDLCSNGQFYYYSNTSSQIASGSVAADNSNVSSSGGGTLSSEDTGGTYKIYSLGQESYLELTFQSGKVVEYDLSTNNSGQLFLDETRYLVLQSEQCH